MNLHQLEKFFCYYWPNSCQNYFSDGELALDHVDDTPENVINGEYESFDSITEDCEVNTSSLVLIVPVKQEQTARKDRVPNKHKTKVYSVASLRSPQLVLTLLRQISKLLHQNMDFFHSFLTHWFYVAIYSDCNNIDFCKGENFCDKERKMLDQERKLHWSSWFKYEFEPCSKHQSKIWRNKAICKIGKWMLLYQCYLIVTF